MKIPCSILLVCTALAAGAQTPVPSQTVSATVDASRTGPPISPYVYGQFVEHIGNLIYGSLWSELLDDRKFYYAVAPQPPSGPDLGRARGGGPARGRRGVSAGRWNPIGPIDAVVMDTNSPYVGEHTPLIQLGGSEPHGIRQGGLNFIKGATYNGRIQLAGDSTAKVSVSVVWGTNASRQTVSLGKLRKDYKKFTFSFKAAESGPAQFEISATGTGSFHIGAVSLMPADNLAGFRPDALAVLKSLRSGVYRFPGGNFVSAHEWRDAIGDPDKRPPVMDPVWKAVQPNDIGTDEFMSLCKLLGVEPYITVSAGFGDAWSAAQYVEYANGAVSTPMGKQRAANGHPEPYRVKFWGIGNEGWGDWQYGAMTLTQFEAKHNQFAKAMRKVDPTIKLIASGAMPDTMTGSKQSLRFGTNLIPPYLSPGDWTGGMLSNCFDNLDLISEHFYNYGNTHFSLAEGRQVPNEPNEPITDWMRRPANHIRIKYEAYREYEKLLPQLVTHPKPLNIDEWAYNGGRFPVYPSYAWVFQEMFRHSDVVQMAGFTFATSLLSRDGTNVALNANGLVFKLYRDHFGSIPVGVAGNSPQPKPSDPPGGEQPMVNAGSDTFPLDVAAAWTEDRRTFTVAVLNPSEAAHSLKLNITGAALSGKGTLWRLASTESNGQNPILSSSPVDSIPGSLTLPPFSVNIYEFPGMALRATAVSANLRVTLKDAYKDAFYVGVAINRTIAMGAAVRADNVNRSLEQVNKDIALVKEQFSQISPENDLKWALIHPREGAEGYDFGPADAFVNFGLSNNMYIVGHTLVWHAQTPNWVFAGTNPPPAITSVARVPVANTDITGTNAPGRGRFGRGFGRGGYTGPRASREELLERMREHIHAVVSRYKGKVKVWDVVNEAIAEGGTNLLRNSLWLQIVGPDFIAKAFEYAHEADPDAILRYNDYSLENPAKRRKLITFIKSLQAQHVPVMAIGSQTHVSVSSPSFEAEDEALTELETLGLPIHITEFDVNSAAGGQRDTGADIGANASTTQGGLVDDANRRLADAYAGLFRAFLKHRNSVKVVTFWGANDAVSWRAQGRPLLFDGNDRPKLAFGAVISEAKQTAEAK